MVTFRSSKYTNDRGFVVAVVCPNLSEQNQPGCLETKEQRVSDVREKTKHQFMYQDNPIVSGVH